MGAPPPLMRGSAAVALTLFDQDTPLWLDRRMSECPEVANWLKFHSGAPVVTKPSLVEVSKNSGPLKFSAAPGRPWNETVVITFG